LFDVFVFNKSLILLLKLWEHAHVSLNLIV